MYNIRFFRSGKYRDVSDYTVFYGLDRKFVDMKDADRFIKDFKQTPRGHHLNKRLGGLPKFFIERCEA